MPSMKMKHSNFPLNNDRYSGMVSQSFQIPELKSNQKVFVEFEGVRNAETSILTDII
jgi:hypothetical protein